MRVVAIVPKANRWSTVDDVSPQPEVFELIATLIPVFLLAGVVRSIWRLNDDEEGSARNFVSGAFFFAFLMLAEVLALVVVAYPATTDMLAVYVFAPLALALMVFSIDIATNEASEMWPEERRGRTVRFVALPLVTVAMASPILAVLSYVLYRV